ncbi:PalH-domain-containing protein [Patellaria atrata CBS 101060]|uniref:PalH-domain-containing protein n=1 Tax=Patellaria atrata CBS 101060 TaxID=1346257 RepID=A0A9P4S901_9PEZI|nr:PalH-domain-containing protein [Patellaria atrata CBS 101060]
MLPPPRLPDRQLWPATTTSSHRQLCTPFTLPSAGVVVLNPSSTITLVSDAVFTPQCTTVNSLDNPQSVVDVRGSFHASITPQAYATGAATVIAWMLVIMLIITPRTFFVGGTGGGRSGLLGRRGMISGATGGASVIGVGSRPWLQKVAALTVAISLTIATADTFKVAEKQYNSGYMDALKLRDEVVGGMEIRISRVISDIFLWLAQVQTLIRLFPRHKEKVLIKWVGFALIVLDMTFSCLNSFMGNPVGRPERFVDAIPALSYLFQLALSMLYAAWVLFYSFTKRRYAFYHSMMWNMSVVAFVSIIAILTPVVFFITDISNYSVAGWGDYFRWVGAAAASVIVWEWVERIEALEREEKKDGILGREIFDGDEMLDVTPSQEINWPRHRHDKSQGGRPPGGTGGAFTSGTSGHRFSVGQRIIRPVPVENGAVIPLGRAHSQSTDQRNDGTPTEDQSSSSSGPSIPTPPPAVASPVSRTETTSADSTVYTVRYHVTSEPTVSVPERRLEDEPRGGDQISPPKKEQDSIGQKITWSKDLETQRRDLEALESVGSNRLRWQALNPFKRRRAEPPPEVQSARFIETAVFDRNEEKTSAHNFSRWDLKSRLGAFSAEKAERFRERQSGRQVEMTLPVTIVPAQPRGRTWSPEILNQQRGSPEQEQTDNGPQTSQPVTVGDNESERLSSQSNPQQDIIKEQPEPSDPSFDSRNDQLPESQLPVQQSRTGPGSTQLSQTSHSLRRGFLDSPNPPTAHSSHSSRDRPP